MIAKEFLDGSTQGWDTQTTVTLPGGFQLVIVLVFILPIWGAIDAALIPDSRWQLADQSKVTWVLLQLLGLIAFGVGGLIAALVYLLRVRPRLRTT